jgi:hypothetical protein
MTRFPYIGFALGLLISMPNLIWQLSHGLPVIDHMRDLAATQLVHVTPITFMSDQIVDQAASSLISILGLIFLLHPRSPLYKYRALAITFFVVLMLILILNGKSYYVFGAYLMLYAAGGIGANLLLKNVRTFKWAVLPLILLLNLPVIPYAIPVLPVERMVSYGAYMKNVFGLSGPLRWEDGKLHDLRQDYADMLGWEEMVQKVARVYHSLSDEDKNSCMIYGGSYGHTSPINYYRDRYFLPEAQSLNNSHLFWADPDISITKQIMVDDVRQDSSVHFEVHSLVDSVEAPYAREKGYIYFREMPRVDVDSAWRALIRERLSDYGRK